MENIKVSIIVPVYNVELYLERCLDSIINQTLESLEIIIINNGSTDKSSVIINRYKEKYKDIIIINTSNIGVGAARNLGIERASGEYIAFLDSDDFVEKTMYENLYEIAVNTKADIVVSGFNFYYEDQEKCNNNVIKNDSKIKYYTREQALEEFLLGNVTTYCWDKMYKREIFYDSDVRFSENISTGEDIIIALMTLNLSTQIVKVDSKLYNYRRHKGSITSSVSKDKIIDHNKMLINCISYAKKYILDIDKDYITYYEVRTLISMFIEYVKLMKFNRNKIYSELKLVFGDLGFKINFKDIVKSKILQKADKIRYILFRMKVLDIYIYLRTK